MPSNPGWTRTTPRYLTSSSSETCNGAGDRFESVAIMLKTVLRQSNVMGSRFDVYAEGVRRVCDRLSDYNWNIEVVREGRRQKFYRISNGRAHYTLMIRALSGTDSVAFVTGLDVLDRIDYLVICSNLKEDEPNLVVLYPPIVRDITRVYRSDERIHWLQPRAYNEHNLGFERVFGHRDTERSSPPRLATKFAPVPPKGSSTDS